MKSAHRTVSLQFDALALAVRFELVLREERMAFDLVDGGDDFGDFEKLFKLGDGAVGHCDGFGFAFLLDFFHLSPGLLERDLGVELSGSVWVAGDQGIATGVS